MKKSLLRKITTRMAGSVAVGLLALGVFGSSQALAGIASTKHNLTSSNTTAGANVFTPGTVGGAAAAEICVFCHTPHGADSSAAVPLWNRLLIAPTYATYNSLGTSSLDGSTAAIGSVSIACLSCHDGVQAMNTIINAPGSGLIPNTNYSTGGGWAGTFQGSGKLTGIALLNDGANGLKNDHPISIQYGGGPASGAAAVSMTAGTVYGFKDPDFKSTASTTLNGSRVWWVDTGTSGNGRQKTDMLLYTRGGSGTGQTFTWLAGTGGDAAATVTQPFVECGSCHDPHVDNVTVAGSNPTFLRIKNEGSAVCLACHIK